MKDNENQNLIERIEELEKILQGGSFLPLSFDQSLIGRGFIKVGQLTGILRSVGGTVTAITPKAGANTYYVAASSGASPTTAITFTNGVQTS